MGRFRKLASAAISVALLATSAGVLTPTTAGAVSQAGGTDLSTWAPGWKWTYARTFHYDAPTGTNVNVNETATYTVVGETTFMGQPAWELSIAGTVNNGSGNACTGSAPGCTDGSNVSLSINGGNITGTQYVRRSDLAELQTHEVQNFSGTAAGLVGITGTFDLTVTPQPGWRFKNFRLHNGDTHTIHETIVTTGVFSYSAGSFGSGSGDLGGTSDFDGTASVSAQTITVPIQSNLATQMVAATSSGDEHTEWWSPNHKNNAKTHNKQVGDDGSNLILDTNLTAAVIPAPGITVDETIAPNLQCGGGQVTVSGTLGTGASGQTVTVTLDKSIVVPGQVVTATTTTGAGGAYSATLTAPLEADGLARPDARGAWGVLVAVGSARQVATLEVRPENCSSLAYTGVGAAPQGSTATLSALLTDTGTNTPVSGALVTFALSGQAGTVSGTTNGSGVATANIAVAGPPRNATVTASFAGSASVAAATTNAGFVVGKVPTQVALASSFPAASVGDDVHFTATVSPTTPAVGTLGGNVQFAVDGSPLGGPVSVVGGSATSPDISTLTEGNHTVTAVYSGDGNYVGSAATPLVQSIHKLRAPTNTSLLSSVNPTVFGQATTLTATVTAPGGGTPTGSVAFKDGATVVATGTLDGSGVATASVDSLTVGTHTLTAAYASDEDFAVSTSGPVSQTVLQAQTTTNVVASIPAPVAGQPVGYTVTVAPVAPGAGAPTGTVNLTIDGTPVPPQSLVGGVAVFPSSGLSAGSHTVAATYAATPSFAASSGSVIVTVAKADTTTFLTTSPNPSVTDQVVTFTATVTPVAPGAGTPSGLVTFFDGADPLGSSGVNGSGQATIALDNLAIGSHDITAVYGGSTNHNGSTSNLVAQVVNERPPIVDTTTDVVGSTNPSTYGQSVTFTATVTPATGTRVPTGSVQFSVDGTDLGAPVALDEDGVAVSGAISTLAAGSHTVIAAYDGDLFMAASGDVAVQSVKQASTTASIVSSGNPSAWDQAVTFTATVATNAPGSGPSGGTVQFRLDGAPLGAPIALVGGSATSPSVSGLDPGHHTISVVSTGDANHKSSVASYDQTVDKVPTTTTLTATPNPIVFGASTTLTATVVGAPGSSGSPTGTVTFTDGSTVLGTAPLTTVGGAQKAQLIVPGLAAGDHPIAATYGGDVRFAGSTTVSPLTVSVGRAPTTLTTTPALLSVNALILTPKAKVVLLAPMSATLRSNGAPVANQPVTFTTGTTVLCTSNTNSMGTAFCNPGVTTLLQIILNGGYKATFAGDANYLGTTATGPVNTVLVLL